MTEKDDDMFSIEGLDLNDYNIEEKDDAVFDFETVKQTIPIPSAVLGEEKEENLTSKDAVSDYEEDYFEVLKEDDTKFSLDDMESLPEDEDSINTKKTSEDMLDEEIPSTDEPPVEDEAASNEETPASDEKPAEDKTPVEDEEVSNEETPASDETSIDDSIENPVDKNNRFIKIKYYEELQNFSSSISNLLEEVRKIKYRLPERSENYLILANLEKELDEKQSSIKSVLLIFNQFSIDKIEMFYNLAQKHIEKTTQLLNQIIDDIK